MNLLAKRWFLFYPLSPYSPLAISITTSYVQKKNEFKKSDENVIDLKDTEISWIVVTWTVHSKRRQKLYKSSSYASINALSFG